MTHISEQAKRNGPTVRLVIKTSCEGCRYLRSDYYCIEDGNDVDSGFTHSCLLPVLPGAPPYRPVDGKPPEDCPFLAEEKHAALSRLNREHR
jgi:hypothetical protein